MVSSNEIKRMLKEIRSEGKETIEIIQLSDIEQLESRKDINGLIKALYYENDPSIQEAAAESLYNLSIKSDILGYSNKVDFPLEKMINALDIENIKVKQDIILILGQMGDERAVSHLLNLMYDKNGDVWGVAFSALEKLLSKDDIEVLFRALDTNNDKAQRKIAMLISTILFPYDAKENLDISSLSLLLNEQNPNIKRGTLEILKFVYYKEDIPDKKIPWLFIKSLNDDNINVKITAINCLGSIKESNAIEPLKELLKEKKKSIRWTSASALGFIGDKTYLDLIVQLVDEIIEDVNDEKSNMHDISINALNGISNIYVDEKMMDAIIKSLSYDEYELKDIAAFILGKIGNKKAVNPLIDILNDNDSQVRKSAIDSLGDIGDSSVVNAIIKSLNDENWVVRLAAVDSLGKLGDKSAILPLTNLLDDKMENVRRRVEEVLDKLSKVQNFNFCCECSAKISENANFCTSCGFKLI